MSLDKLLSTLERLSKLAANTQQPNAEPRTQVVRAMASFIVASRAVRGRDDIFERQLWAECIALADSLEGAPDVV